MLISAVAATAPLVCLHSSGKPDRKAAYLRNGLADLEIGVVEDMRSEIRVRALFRDRYLGVVRGSDPLTTDDIVTAARYAAFGHVVTPPGERISKVLDAGLDRLAYAALSPPSRQVFRQRWRWHAHRTWWR